MKGQEDEVNYFKYLSVSNTVHYCLRPVVKAWGETEVVRCPSHAAQIIIKQQLQCKVIVLRAVYL